ncbi:hypothetical protein [Streptomyces sp. RerS4]|uniref:hypothetical protein n=1 Tax=Streptomyces sp. RerS4 TaxID=2942449 RepID=UPI00201C60A3|nr:hypothetical protein [Streptomyces sp. RerS4]UQX00971.1 hypothetical protein M4D82_10835 [Streptomyces sp. RerS4]
MNASRWAVVAGGVVLALAGGVALGGAALSSPPAPPDPMGWVPVEPVGGVPARTGRDAARGAVLAELTAATAASGVTDGAPLPAPQGATTDCVADWMGTGPADGARLAAVEAELTRRGWRVTGRRGDPVPETRFGSGPWTLTVGNGGLLNTLSLLAERHDRPCDEAFRRDAATREPHHG